MHEPDDGATARTVFRGLAPDPAVTEVAARPVLDTAALTRSMRATMPFVLAGAMTVTFNLTGPLDPADAAERERELDRGSETPARGTAVAEVARVARADVPLTHAVAVGETVGSIAEEYGLSTASLLARNGLGWKSLIFPGQILTLRAPAASDAGSVTPTGTITTVRAGDTVSRIAERYEVGVQSLLDANGLTWSSVLYPGQKLAIPESTVTGTPEAPRELEITPVAAAAAPDKSRTKRSSDTDANAPSTSRHYTVRSGDTLSAIAARFGIGTQRLLDANGLGWSSVIYPGMRLTIPGSGAGGSGSGNNGSSGNGGSGGSNSVTQLTAEQQANARIIIRIGRKLDVPSRGIVIALATAMQESSLRNLDWGDRDSVGLFQQRPSAGWGKKAKLLDPEYAARLFYGGPQNPNAGKTRGLLDIPGWQKMSLTEAAQAVQISAYPNAYAKWETSARAWYRELG